MQRAGQIGEVPETTLAGVPHEICSGDFDGDGWADFVSSDVVGKKIEFYRNVSWDGKTPFNTPAGSHGVNDDPAPTWSIPTSIRTARFMPYTIESRNSGSDGSQAIGCGDMNGDGKQDFYIIDTDTSETTSGAAVARADMYLGTGNFAAFNIATLFPNTASTRYQLTATAGATGLNWFKGMRADSEAKSVDINGDGKLDIVLASSANGTAFSSVAPCSNAANCGLVRAYFNNGATPPKFIEPTVANNGVLVLSKLVSMVNDRGFNALDFGDFNQDGKRDIVVAGVAAKDVRIHYGLQGGGFAATPQLLTSPVTPPAGQVAWNRSGAQNVMVSDFNLDGKPDVLMATDQGRVSATQTARWYLWQNKGTPNFVGGPTNMTWTATSPSTAPVPPDTAKAIGLAGSDSDVGVLINYDNDPDNTKDFILVNGNTTNAGYKLFTNRVTSTYAPCGTVYSDPLPLGTLQNTEMVVTGARITPTWALNGGTITLYASNEDPANWQLASLCSGSTTDYCAAFPKPSGRTVRWKVEMCSNASRTQTPTIAGMNITFAYQEAAVHYRAGVVAESGVAYVGGFRQPGDRGHVFALPAQLSTTSYWDFGQRLDAATTRDVFTTETDGVTRLPFSTALATDPNFQAALGVANDTDATSIVNWWNSGRFGQFKDKRLGGLVESTPAIVTPPQRPYYYNFAPLAERTLLDNFIAANTTRPRLVIAGTKDGALHAMNTEPTATCIVSTFSGTEAWAFVPRRVANGFLSDKNNGTTDSYVDGPVSLSLVVLGGQVRTVALFGLGNGGRSYTALDVTNTVANTSSGGCVTGQSVLGPTPLWDYAIDNSGLTRSKPVMVRTKINGSERFVAVLASGVDPSNPTGPWSRGREVHGVDLATGQRLWRFQAKCPVTTDIAAFETDDALEPNAPALDGFIDRVVFGDTCGNVYKVDPGQENADWVQGIGPVNTGVTDPANQITRALFSVAGKSPIPAGEERPIFGTLGVREDSAGRVTVFFGTGGVESFTPTKINAFFAIYADNGTVRDTVAGTCGTDGRCDKFYGGIVVTADQVIATRAKDAAIASTTCDQGSAQIVAFNVANLAQQFVVQSSASIQSSLFGVQGAIFSTNVAGQVIRVGAPSAPTPGTGSGPPGAFAVALKRRNWRQVF
ncbi:MAG: VCBS repeat-containing protein [Kofleriaceae bacterium]|nr:VCBS repeat-containing protein [Kofleriaceae bacterium]